jgi:hypothetical protein
MVLSGLCSLASNEALRAATAYPPSHLSTVVDNLFGMSIAGGVELAADRLNDNHPDSPVISALTGPVARTAIGLTLTAVVEYGKTAFAMHSKIPAGAAFAMVTGMLGYVTAIGGGALSSTERCQPTRVKFAEPGDELADGTIYVGQRTSDDKYVVTTPALLPNECPPQQVLKFDPSGHLDKDNTVEMMRDQGLDTHGHNDWQAPDEETSDMLYDNKDTRALAGTLEVAAFPDPAYPLILVSKNSTLGVAWVRSFTHGKLDSVTMHTPVAQRPVRVLDQRPKAFTP